MDVTTILTMFREIMDEQKNVIANVMNEQKNNWLSAKKLDPNIFGEKYPANVAGQRDVTEIGFTETVDILKQLFDFKSSLFTTRYQCLKLEKSQSEDFLTYTGRVNEFCERAKIHELDSDGIKCLLWIFGLKSQQEAEIRQRLITVLDRDHKAGKTVSLQQLHQECENFLSLKRDSEVVAGTMKLVEATSRPRRLEGNSKNGPTIVLSGMANTKPWFCKKCRKVGHKERFCDTLRQKKTASRTEATQKTQHTKEKFSGNRNNRGPRKQVRIVKIANAAVQANSSRVYIDAVVNNYSVKFLLDTGSDITLLNEKIWKKMGSPALEKTNIVVKNASGDTMKIYGKLKCKITMKGVNTEGEAYVTPHSSLLGLEWIRANENLMYHIEMMAEVKANCNPRRKEELKKTLKRGIRNLKGEEKLSEDTFNVIRQAYRTTPHRCLEDRTKSSTWLYAEENRRKIKEQ
ncbi:hypothetical protein COOONC_01721 [Cooperia oncophora]